MRAGMKGACLALLCCLGLALAARAQTVVRVGGYEFAPYVEAAAEAPTGVTLDLIALLNRRQSQWRFEFVPTTPMGRYADFAARRFDVLLFEDPAWGWGARDFAVEASQVFGEDAEIFIAQTGPLRDEAWFASLRGRRIAGVRGYHYAFADYIADEEELNRRFSVALYNDSAAVMEAVVRGWTDVGVVARSYARRHMAERPDIQRRLLLSQKADQVYRHRVLARRGSQPGAAGVHALIQGAAAAGELTPLYRRYGLAE